MLSDYNKLFIKLSFFLIVILVPLVCFNYMIDPFGYFRTNFSQQQGEPNQHFIKMKMLISKKIIRNSFIFGSSRVGKIYTFDNSRLGGYYNMVYAEGVPFEHLQDIKILLRHGVKIKNILIGVDNISYLVAPKLHLNDPMKEPYPDEKYLRGFICLKYLLSPRSVFSYRSIGHRSSFSVNYDIYKSGSPIVIGKDDWVEKNTSVHVADKKFLFPAWESSYKPRVSSTISEIKSIKNICDSNSINLILFVNPMHEVTYRKQNIDIYFQFLRKLAEISDYYDFSGINKITTNNYYYYETSHYRPIVGDMIVNRIFEAKPSTDFGYFVTSRNIEVHLTKLRGELSK